MGIAVTDQYERLLNQKIQHTREQFASHYSGEIRVFPSPASHYRMRAEFRIWHEGNTSHYVMFDEKNPVVVENYTIGSKQINTLMWPLLEAVREDAVLRYKLYQVEFLTTLSGDALITLIYHKQLDETWLSRARDLQTQLGCAVIGRSKKQKVILDRDYVTESFELDCGKVDYQQIETAFSQPNAKVCISMLNWAFQHAKKLRGDLLELYCGNGNFTLPLARAFDKVFATEVSKLSIKAANHNIAVTGADNIVLARMSAEEVSQAMCGQRAFRRLENIDLGDYNFSTVFVDPPRSGLDEQTLSFVHRFNYILYVSCNPLTLKSNLDALQSSHRVLDLALFDQFPYTEHRECGVLLEKC